MICVGVDSFYALYKAQCLDLLEYIKTTYRGHYVSEANARDKMQVFDYYETIGVASQAYIANLLKYELRFGKKEGRNRKDLLKAAHYAVLLLGHTMSDEHSNMRFNEDIAITRIRDTELPMALDEIQSFCYLASTEAIWGWLVGEIILTTRKAIDPHQLYWQKTTHAARVAGLTVLALMWFDADLKGMSIHEAVEAYAGSDFEPAQAPASSGDRPGF